jgi:hypothetical protein
MIEHSCCCIWDFVMSGLNQIQFGFENPLKIGFEKFEKEKKERNFLLRAAFSRSPVLGLPPRARPAFSCACLRFLGQAHATASRPVFARAAASRTRAADEPVPPVSDHLPFPFLFLRFFPTTSMPSSLSSIQ